MYIVAVFMLYQQAASATLTSQPASSPIVDLILGFPGSDATATVGALDESAPSVYQNSGQ